MQQNWNLADVRRAIMLEQDQAKEPLLFKVKSVARTRGHLRLEVIKKPGVASGTLDENLEETRAWWLTKPGAQPCMGTVKMVNPDDGELVIRAADQATIEVGAELRVYPVDYLQKLLDAWNDGMRAARALNMIGSARDRLCGQPRASSDLPLRARQRQAIELTDAQIGLLHGPPGTGKTYTLGVNIARLVASTSWRILVTATTNTAVDLALLSADDALARMGRDDLRGLLTRMGSGFDPDKFKGRDHLLPAAKNSALEALRAHNAKEPDKKDAERWIAWKEIERALRAQMRTDVSTLFGDARVIAATSASILYNLSAYDTVPWRFLVVDEASQLTGATAVMMATLSERVLFAGDPKQLPAVVQSEHPLCRRYMRSTAFDIFEDTAPSVRLNEQSRMSPDLCELVSKVFYRGELAVAGDKAHDRSWHEERKIGLPGSKQDDAIIIRRIGSESQWSQNYGGRIRYESAKACVAKVKQLLSRGVAESDIWALTPYRAQRNLLRNILYAEKLRAVSVSTVHRAQGGERRVVIFDPVEAGGKFLNGELGDRLLNVALSRAMAQVVLLVSQGDLTNQRVAQIEALARAICTPSLRASGQTLAELLRTHGFGKSAIGHTVQVGDTVGNVVAFERDGAVVVIRCLSTGALRKYRTRMAA